MEFEELLKKYDNLVQRSWPSGNLGSVEMTDKYYFPVTEELDKKLRFIIKQLQDFINDSIDGTSSVLIEYENPPWPNNLHRDRAFLWCKVTKVKPNE